MYGLNDIVYYIDVDGSINDAQVLGTNIKYLSFEDYKNNKVTGTITLGHANVRHYVEEYEGFYITKVLDVNDVYLSRAKAEKALKIKLNHLTRKQKEKLNHMKKFWLIF